MLRAELGDMGRPSAVADDDDDVGGFFFWNGQIEIGANICMYGKSKCKLSMLTLTD